ncbi:MAG: phosphatidate cytidylyltransferase, partial [Fimbriimonadaceae bacterium]|nr:phosphatidate cytidylyltransferase [Alphaproteobacteria bacterium]
MRANAAMAAWSQKRQADEGASREYAELPALMEIGSVKIPNLAVRLISTLVLVPLALAMIWYGGWPFNIFVMAGGLLVLYEWHSITRTGGLNLVVAGASLIFSAILCALGQVVLSCLVITAMSVILVLGSLIGKFPGSFWSGLGAFYVTLPVLALILLRSDMQSGLAAVAYVMIVVWVTDSAAYGAGRAIG